MTAEKYEGNKGEEKRRSFLIPLIAFSVFALMVFAAYQALRWDFERAGPNSREHVVLIERGTSLAASARLLEKQGIVRDARRFQIAARLIGASRPVQAGEYLFQPQQSMHGALKLMQSGKTVLHRLTIAEGITSAEVVEILRGEDKLDGDIETLPMEGSLLPETYFFARGEQRAKILKRMQHALDEALDKAWRERNLQSPLTSRRDALILASIVEKETALAEERRRVAGVFIHRLRRGMRLQSDPTVAYGLAKGHSGRSLTVKDLDSDTPFNTYRIVGLPPAPIANPGLASIKAALDPLVTDELYFVADGNGGHVFAKTLAEHNANVRNWRRIEAERRKAAQENGKNE